MLTAVFALGMAWADPIRFSLLQSFLTSVRFCLALAFLDPRTTIPFQARLSSIGLGERGSCFLKVTYFVFFNHISYFYIFLLESKLIFLYVSIGKQTDAWFAPVCFFSTPHGQCTQTDVFSWGGYFQLQQQWLEGHVMRREVATCSAICPHLFI